MASFQEQRAHSAKAERFTAHWLLRRVPEARILPTYDFSGQANDKAPRLEGRFGKLIMPDLLLMFPAGTSRWVEVKLKTETTLHRKSGVINTGFPLRHWRDYRNVEKATGSQVVVIFIHLREAKARAATLGQLAPHARIDPSGKMSRGGMIFFDWARIPRCPMDVSSLLDLLRCSLEATERPTQPSCVARRPAQAATSQA